MSTYVPRVLLCGNEDDFRKTIGEKPVEVVGRTNFAQAGDAFNRLRDDAEYFVFTDAVEFALYLKNFPPNRRAMSAETYATKIHDGFFSYDALNDFYGLVRRKKIFGRVLDFDCYLAKSDFRTAAGDFKAACIAQNFAGATMPIYENVYAKIFRTFDECRLQLFDALLLTAERTPEEFSATLIDTDALSENVLTFVRKNSPLESWLQTSQKIFAQVDAFKTDGGHWCLLKKVSPPADVGIYIVTHKDAKLSAPKGYKIIHAGHALAKNDFGYVGDDTGDNISRLNVFLDEITALYWIWRNTTHTHAGLVHYRRLLTSKPTPKRFNAKDILSAAEIVKLLREYDVIACTEMVSDRNQRELMIMSTGSPELVAAAEEIVRKHLARVHADYLDAFDAVINGFVFFEYGIHVTRRNILDAYCTWLFAFLLDATEEMSAVTVDGKKLDEMPHVYSRMMSFFAERMLTVWLMKNHLRIKTLPIMYRDDV